MRLCTVTQNERLSSPTARLPVHTFEGRLNTVRTPYGRILLIIAATCRIQLQNHSVSGLADIHAALRHIDMEQVFRFPALEHHFVCALGGEAVLVCLAGACHANGGTLHITVVHLHLGRGGVRIIGYILKGELCILPNLKCRGQVGVRENTTIGKTELRTDERNIRTALENVDVDTLTLQNKPCAGFHLCHHLDCMATKRQARHRHAKTSVSGTASCYGGSIVLRSVKVYGYDLCSRTADCIGDIHGIINPVATVRYGIGKVIGACQGEGDNFHRHITLLGLRLTRSRIYRGGTDINVCGTHLQVFGEVKRISTFAHILNGIAVYGR